ncbi:MAG: hypothetical protein J6D00_05880 [Christensenellaceae bacterium]|nr:hypothetical protein [Christensenellaceae bacterium]
MTIGSDLIQAVTPRQIRVTVGQDRLGILRGYDLDSHLSSFLVSLCFSLLEVESEHV